MDGGAASIVNSTIRISQIVYEFKAVGEQARDLLASTNHVSRAIDTTRELRRQKSAYLASTEKEWIDSTIVAAERTLNNVASLVEPVRVDMQTKFGKIGLMNRGLFVFRDSPKVLTHLNQLSMTHVSLVNALSTLSQRQADISQTPSPVLDRRASQVTLTRPPTYEESEFLDRRRGKMRSVTSLANLAEENTDTTSSIGEDSSESHATNTESHTPMPISSGVASPKPMATIDMVDEKCLVSEFGDTFTHSYSMPDLHDHTQYTSPAELDGDVSATWGHQRPCTYQAWDPSMNPISYSSQWQTPKDQQPSSSHHPPTRHSEPILPTMQSRQQPNTAHTIPKIICSNQPERYDELHFPSASIPTQDRRISLSASNVPSPLRPATPTSPVAVSSHSELPSRTQTPTRYSALPYPDDLIPTNSSSPFPNPSQPSLNHTIGLGVTLPHPPQHQSGPSPCHRAQSYPGTATQAHSQAQPSSDSSSRPGSYIPTPPTPSHFTSRFGTLFSEASHAHNGTATHPPLERSISQPITSSSGKARRYAWLEHQSAQTVVEDCGFAMTSGRGGALR